MNRHTGPALLVSALLTGLLASPAASASGPQFSLSVELPDAQASLSPSALPDLNVQAFVQRMEDELSAEEADRLRKRMKARRDLLAAHQTLALVTWGTMTANIVFGTMQYSLRVLNTRGIDPVIQDMHKAGSYATAGLYLTTGILAWSAPPPIRRPGAPSGGQDSSKLHKALSWVHGFGMLGLVIGGIMQSYVLSRASGSAWIGATTAHLILGWTTWGITTAAGTAILFF